MANLKLLGQLGEVQRVLVVNAPEVVFSMFLLGAKATNESVDTLKLICTVLH